MSKIIYATIYCEKQNKWLSKDWQTDCYACLYKEELDSNSVVCNFKEELNSTKEIYCGC